MTLEPLEAIDRLFGNEAARSAYRKFWKYSFKSNEESSTLSIIRLDAYITRIVDSIASIVGVNVEEITSLAAKRGWKGKEVRYQ